MPAKKLITSDQLEKVATAIFNGGAVRVFDVYSENNCTIQKYDDAEMVLYKLFSDLTEPRHYSFLGIRYDDFGADVETERIELNPEKFPKASFRHRCSGWGMITFHVKAVEDGVLEAVFNANSFKRAQALELTLPALGPVNAWNWHRVDSQTRRLTRVLAKLEKSRK